MSFRQPSQVSATTGSDHAVRRGRCRASTRHAIDRVAHHADAVRVGDHHRPFEEPGFLDPGRAGHLAVAVEREPAGEHRILRVAPARQDRGDAGAHRALPTFSLPSPEMSVVKPTSTPATSVIALSGPGVPSNGTPRSRARGFCCAVRSTATRAAATIVMRPRRSRVTVWRASFARVVNGYFHRNATSGAECNTPSCRVLGCRAFISFVHQTQGVLPCE